MAIENARAFVEKVRQDASLQEQLKELRRQARQDLLAAVAVLGSRAGFAFDTAEYDQTLRERARQLSIEELKQRAGGAALSDEELQNVAGSGIQHGAGDTWSRYCPTPCGACGG